MKPETKKLLKEILIVLAIGVVAFIVWEIIKAIKAGASDIGSILKAPFTALSSIWTGITGLFSASPSLATPQPAPIINSSGQTVGTVAPSSPFYSLFAPTDQAYTQSLANTLLGNTPAPASGPIDFSTYPTS
jgi:hypothetical protein